MIYSSTFSGHADLGAESQIASWRIFKVKGDECSTLFSGVWPLTLWHSTLPLEMSNDLSIVAETVCWSESTIDRESRRWCWYGSPSSVNIELSGVESKLEESCRMSWMSEERFGDKIWQQVDFEFDNFSSGLVIIDCWVRIKCIRRANACIFWNSNSLSSNLRSWSRLDNMWFRWISTFEVL